MRLLEQVVQFVLADQADRGAAILLSIRPDALEEEKERLKREVRQSQVYGAGAALPLVVKPAGARNLSEQEKLIAFARDGFFCRYAHCRRPTVIPPVLRALGETVYPAIMKYDAHWGPSHPIYWLYMASGEHVVPWADSQSSDVETNVVTTSYWCNQLKGRRSKAKLGWELSVDRPPWAWDGLSNYCEELCVKLELGSVPYFRKWLRAIHALGIDPA